MTLSKSPGPPGSRLLLYTVEGEEQGARLSGFKSRHHCLVNSMTLAKFLNLPGFHFFLYKMEVS